MYYYNNFYYSLDFSKSFGKFKDEELSWEERSEALQEIKQMAIDMCEPAILFLGIANCDEDKDWEAKCVYDNYTSFLSVCPEAANDDFFYLNNKYSYRALDNALVFASRIGNTWAIPAYAVFSRYGKSNRGSFYETALWCWVAVNRNNLLAIKVLASLFENYDCEYFLSDIADLYKKGVEHGDTQCMCELGMRYIEGNGVDQSTEKGLELLNRAVELGDAEVMRMLGEIYWHGNGVEVDKDKALEYLTMAADRNHGWAQNILISKYRMRGEYMKALECTEKYNPDKEFRKLCALGEMYEKGLGVEQSLDEAEKCYRKILEDPEMQIFSDYLALLMYNRDGKRSESEILELMRKSWNAGNNDAKAWLDEHCVLTLKPEYVEEFSNN